MVRQKDMQEKGRKRKRTIWTMCRYAETTRAKYIQAEYELHMWLGSRETR
jgi:hypothetical protein